MFLSTEPKGKSPRALLFLNLKEQITCRQRKNLELPKIAAKPLCFCGIEHTKRTHGSFFLLGHYLNSTVFIAISNASTISEEMEAPKYLNFKTAK